MATPFLLGADDLYPYPGCGVTFPACAALCALMSAAHDAESNAAADTARQPRDLMAMTTHFGVRPRLRSLSATELAIFDGRLGIIDSRELAEDEAPLFRQFTFRQMKRAHAAIAGLNRGSVSFFAARMGTYPLNLVQTDEEARGLPRDYLELAEGTVRALQLHETLSQSQRRFETIHRHLFSLVVKQVRETWTAPRVVESCRCSDPWNPLAWVLTLRGPEATPYEGGHFRLLILLSPDHPFRPPRVRFMTKVFHPNINERGDVSLDILSSSGWSPAISLLRLAETLHSLLEEPNPDDPLRVDIAAEYKTDPPRFAHRAAKWTKKFALPNLAQSTTTAPSFTPSSTADRNDE